MKRHAQPWHTSGVKLALRYLGHRDTAPGSAVSLEVGQEVVVPSEGLVLGRSSSTGLRVASSRVARKHVRVIPLGDALMVTDLGSTNGTQLRGSHAFKGQLGIGDSLTLAEEFEFEVVAGDS